MVNELIKSVQSNSNNNYEMTINQKDNVDLLYVMIKKMFSNQNIQVRKRKNSTDSIIIKRNNEIITESSLEDIQKSILLTNSDQYKTQKNQMEKLVFPKAILSLQNEEFVLKGYPKAYNEKLILISISRYIEKLSYKYGGIHHSTFQKISRINDEKSTKEVYELLSDTTDELHIYGQPDADITIHGTNVYPNLGSSKAYKKSWIVIHLSDNHAAALVAVEKEKKFNEWNAIWTFDREKVINLEKQMKNYF